MKILVTGSAGFIGYNICKKLINRKNIVYGIDNFDNYYSVKYKNQRINDLKKNKNFIFHKIDITNLKQIKNYLKKFNFDIIINLAAQAGVRYSYINPGKYIDTNIRGYLNLILYSKKQKLKKIIYASSSSVYGDSINFPLKENEKLSPKNIYGSSKMLNEKISETYSKIYNIPFIGLRFFTIFGEWGRPDMFLFKLFKSYFNKDTFYLNNFGNHERDFTYIDDVTNMLVKLTLKKNKGHKVFNISSNNPINIKNIINNFTKDRNIKLKKIEKNKADMLKTHGDNKKILNYLNIKLNKNFEKNFLDTFNWYSKNYKNKNIN
tara:strand:- start:31 stop:990 length:960 start_codon:yes stop_codon:yes gene_type:complete